MAAMRSIQRLVSYLVRSTPSGNVRVSTRFRFTQLSRAVKNGVPPPTRTGWVTIAYSSINPARTAAAARLAPPTSMGPPSSVLSRVISVTASPLTRRAFQSTALVVEENTTFGISRQRGPPLQWLVARHAPAEVVAGGGDVAVQAQVHAKGQFSHGVSLP